MAYFINYSCFLRRSAQILDNVTALIRTFADALKRSALADPA
jgi:hypothetical protein